MFRVSRTIHFCYGHRLLNYAGKCRHLHGHNGRVEIELSAARLDRRGIVRDFEEIKRTIQRWIDTMLDHTMLLRKDDPVAKPLSRRGERILLLPINPTAEMIAKLIFEEAKRLRFPVTSVRMWETDDSFATYRPPESRRSGTSRSRVDRAPSRSPGRSG